ncbi:DUF3040 domain-containing protein [Kibdelosporangium aridum]|nr:DUF3040 domain-containing protein [Kibdelosporangium aridum]
MLSRHERQVLREIEQFVTEKDPDFAAMLCGGPTRPPRHSRRYQVVAVAAIAGLCTVLLGVLLAEAILMIGGACMALSAWLRVLVLRWADEN